MANDGQRITMQQFHQLSGLLLCAGARDIKVGAQLHSLGDGSIARLRGCQERGLGLINHFAVALNGLARFRHTGLLRLNDGLAKVVRLVNGEVEPFPRCC